MKKIIWVLALVVLFVSLFIPVVIVAEDSNSNLEKAGQAALAERETTLTQMKEEIESFVSEAANDQIVTKDEMVTLRNLFNNFVKTKLRFNRELEIYDLETSVALGEEYGKAIDAYFKENALFKRDNKKEDARIFFVAKTGVDVTIKMGAVFDGPVISLIAVLVIFLLATILFICAKSWYGGIANGILFTILLVTLILA